MLLIDLMSWDETPGELGQNRVEEEIIITPEEVRENAAIQNQMADLFVDVMENEHIRHDVKGANQVVSSHRSDQRQ